jgi:anti-sigma factor RsiW
MNINRHNYEEFFILYVDDELGTAERKAVELFVQQHPDLEEELAMLEQSKLVPDNSILFDDKETLMKAVVGSAIDIDNYEEWLLLYTDNELTGEQKELVEKFISDHPAVQKELELLQKTKLQPEEIIFSNKESLYRRAEKVRVISIRWQRIAAAAVLFFAVSITAFIIFNNNRSAGSGGPLAGMTNSGAQSEKAPTQTVRKNSDAQEQNNQHRNISRPGNEGTGKGDRVIAMQTSRKTEVRETEGKNSDVTDNAEKTDNVPLPDNFVPKMIGKPDEKSYTGLADAEIPTKNELTNFTEKKQPLVTSHTDPSLQFAKMTAKTDNKVDADQSDKTGSVRGFLRRITRTFEKTTNIKATDEDDRLLVGGLAIKL